MKKLKLVPFEKTRTISTGIASQEEVDKLVNSDKKKIVDRQMASHQLIGGIPHTMKDGVWTPMKRIN
jgi:hypothetical protein